MKRNDAFRVLNISYANNTYIGNAYKWPVKILQFP